ncbi:2-isopropylmalate synthase [Leptospira langatensis]|uniref:2-isopropylmalate synthase n=1 Tax=Leptospira langatensis TaxID=2484983 RepID=A0A5F1ZYA2_9LEPT|nr:(R)-citramalate synthase CimA [Leptospira langatensis]TGK04286.1 2-isopropylmalate synthase [Leptospira langatensis]TGL43766.1 2-isopropylmalate synthase [Leptospira langatensis]
MKEERSKVQILDVTLRDGEQTRGVSFSASEKLNIAKFLLQNLKVDRVEVASARVSEGELDSVRRIMEWANSENVGNRIEILGFVDSHKSVDWILASGARTLNLLTKGSLKHLEGQLKKSPQEHFEEVSETITYAKKNGLEVNVYLEDWSNGYLNSKDYVLDFVAHLSKEPLGKIFLPDTLGVLSPEETYEGISLLTQKYPELHFEFHGHNDYDLSVANCLFAVKAGAKGLHVSVNGLGERAGNSPLEAVITALHDKAGIPTGVDEKAITEASRLVEVFSGKRISANRPVVGEDVFTQTAGVHADGDKKGNLYANPILPERFGRKRSYALGKLAGKASISENLKQLGLVLSPEIEKKVLAKVIELGDKNKTITPEDLPFIIADVSGSSGSRSALKILDCKINSGLGIRPKAFVALELNGKQYSEEGEGDGGYDAFMSALTNIAAKAHISIPRLVDYEVRIPPGGKTDALVETMITWNKAAENHEEENFKTIGVHSDQTIAAVLATEKMLNLILQAWQA